jgi:AraC family transcriptional regulator
LDRYADWIRSDHFQPLLKQHGDVAGSGANMFFVRQDHACPDPATQDVTLQLMRRGAGRFNLDLGVGRFEPLMRADDFCLTPDRVPVHLESEGRCEFLVLAMHGDRLREAVGGVLARPTVDLSSFHAGLNRDPQIATAMHWLWDEAQAGAPNGRLYADGVLAVITARLAGMLGQTPTPRGALARWQVDRVTDYLSADLSAGVALADLAALVGLSEAHFCRGFKRATGCSPLQWQLSLRMSSAKSLLVTTQVPISDVAAACGYAQPAHFAKLFRRATGVSPMEWRRQRLS